MIARRILPVLLASALPAIPSPAQTVRPEYLSQSEADKIRDAETPSARLKLFVEFAQDRLKKFQYELSHPTAGGRHTENLNGLLNAYTGCIDDGADTISVAIDRQQDIREGLKVLQARAKEFLATLQGFQKQGPELDLYKETLDDAIEATQDAIADADKAEKQIHPPPPPPHQSQTIKKKP